MNKEIMEVLISIIENPSQSSSDKLEDIKELLGLRGVGV